MDALTELRRLIARHAGADGSRLPALDGVELLSSSGPTAPLCSMAEPAFGLVAQGAKQTVLGDTVFDYGAGDYLVASVDLPVTGHVTQANPAAPFLAVSLALRPPAIASLLLEAAAPAPRPGGAPAGLAVSTASAELLDAVVRLVRLLDRPDDAAALRPAYEREILWRLISGEQGATVRQIGLADSRLAHVSRAIGWIRRHYDETVRVEELARMTAMSVSAFHRQFRAVTHMTPIQYQKHVRLQEARAQLIAQPESVAAVGFAVGYDSPSQFSRDYRRMFGAPPGRDAAELRRASALDAGAAAAGVA
jgi:AraC-like DNA-binding protein